MKQNEILFFLGSICIVVFAWIAFSILHDSVTSTISSSVNQAIIPIQPTFDTKVMNAMKNRTVVNPLFTIQPPSQNTIIVAVAPTSTPSAIPLLTSPTQSASTGGQLK